MKGELELSFLEDAISNWLGSLQDPESSAALLARGCRLLEDVRDAVFSQTGFRCSAGIAHNKVSL